MSRPATVAVQAWKGGPDTAPITSQRSPAFPDRSAMPAAAADNALQVALLEDDLMLRDRILLPGLANFGFVVAGLETVVELEQYLATRRADIVVLDVGLPDGDGFTVARGLRTRFPGIGIVMLTGRGETPDRVRGLSEGADAYLSKPVEIELLAATLHSLARRLRDVPLPAPRKHWDFDANGWCLVSPAGRSVALTKSERLLLHALAASAGEVVARESLAASLTDNVYDFDMHRLDSMVHRLRRKVADACGEQLPLAAVHGEGYVLNGFS
jgi:DNA-binding response OmpR family regulator